MKNIRSIVIAGITAVMAFSVCSCDSYLDVDRYIYDMTSLDSIFKRKSLLEQYINGASCIYRVKKSCGGKVKILLR